MIALAGLVWAALVLVPGPGGQAVAGRLVMDVSGRAQVLGGKIRIMLTVTNRGDEPALEIQAEAPGDFPAPKSLMAERLEPGGSVELDLQAKPGGPEPGAYIKVVLVNFRDSMNHPFTALAEIRYDLGPGTESPVIATAQPVTLSDRRLVKIGLTNQGQEALNVRARVFAPRELSAAQPGGSMKLDPGQSRTLFFDLWNLSGLAGSVYPVVVVLEHLSHGRHATRAVRIMATLTPRQNPVMNHLEWWLAAIVLTLILLIGAQFRTGGRP